MSKNKKTDIAEPIDFEQSMGQLEALVEALEEGELSLEASLDAFEEGIKLTKTCQKQLDDARQKVSLLVGDGNDMQLEDFESSGIDDE